MMSGQYHTDQLKRIKKRKWMKSPTSHMTHDSTECSDGESEGYEEEKEDAFDNKELNTENVPTAEENAENQETHICEADPIIDITPNNKLDMTNDTFQNSAQPLVSDIQTEATHETTLSTTEPSQGDDDIKTLESSKQLKYDLKPDAKEFVPKAFNHSEIPFSSVQFIKVSPNFIPVPLIPINNQNFNSSFIPPGIPVNFVPPDPKMFISFLQNSPISKKVEVEKDPLVTDQLTISDCDNSNTAPNVQFTKTAEDAVEKKINNNNPIDIATIVSKLEEAAKQQKEEEWNKKSFKKNEQYVMNYKKHVCNNLQSTPQPEQFCKQSPLDKIESTDKMSNNTIELVNNKIYKTELPSKMKSNIDRQNIRYIRKTSDKYKIDRKLPYQNNFNKRYSKEETNVTSQQTRNKISSGNKESCRIRRKNGDSSMEKVELNEENPSIKFITTVNKPTNNWISVCSKKRKRNKGAEETVGCEKEQDCNQSGEFETFDINLIVQISSLDVEMNNNCEKKEIEEEIFNSPTQIENGQSDTSDCPRLEIKHVHIEKDLTEGNESDEVPHKLQFESINNVESLVESVCSEDESKLNTVNDKVNKRNNKNNSTKRKQKTTTKRVIITDIDLSEKPNEIKSSSRNNVTTTETEKITLVETESKEVPEILLKPEVKPCIPQLDEQYCSSESGVNDEDKKKSKKKKKKSAKLFVSNASFDNSSLDSSTLNDSEDTFDFLDSAFAGESQEKTNDEIYHELDKIIQRGMYGNLEEKIKSLNINEGDGFFKSMFSKVSFREKPPKFNEFLQTAQTVGKPNLVSEEINSQNNNSHTLINDLDLPTQDDFFLENPAFMEVLEDQTDTEIQTELHTNLNTKEDIKMENMEDPKTLYPITEAVKEWMCRTRETTPDVDILKSPSTIYKELYGSASVGECESETEVGVFKNLSGEEEDDEITVFSTDRKGSVESNLMDYWEDEVEGNHTETNFVSKHGSSRGDEEETIEIYESEYGKNNFFLQLNKDPPSNVNNVNFPENSRLPHKAVCCNIM